MTERTRTRLFDGQKLRATLIDWDTPASDIVVKLVFRRPVDQLGFGPASAIGFFETERVATLHLQAWGNDWFVNEETQAVEDLFAQHPALQRPTKAIGYSMGGYGALRFAKALNCERVVLISPQVSIHKDVVPFDRRYRTEGALFDPVLGDLNRYKHPTLQGDILIDPFFKWDVMHAKAIQQIFPKLRICRLPGGGHPASGLLGSHGRGGLVTKMLQGGAEERSRVYAKHRSLRKDAPQYWKGLARACKKRRPQVAEQALARAETLTQALD